MSAGIGLSVPICGLPLHGNPMTQNSIRTQQHPLCASPSEQNTDLERGSDTSHKAIAKKLVSPGPIHRALRAATRHDHAMLDRMVLRLKLTRKEDYGLFLHIHYSALQDLKADWRSDDQEDFTKMLACLQADLQALGIVTTKLHAAPQTPGLSSSRMGVAYVIRGSRLGARLIRREVPSQFPTGYLDFVPELSWSHFLQQLEHTSESVSGTTEGIIHGAKITFESFAKHFIQAMA